MIRSGYTAIIDYQIGNLFSVQNAMQNIGVKSIITSDKDVITKADAVVLPGVGAFGDAMSSLKKLDLIYPVKEYVDSRRPFMGICLGLQLLFSESEEFGNNKGLDIIPGYVKKFDFEKSKSDRNIKIPQIAWNRIQVSSQSWEGTELDGLQNGEFMYFVHSFFVIPENANDQLSITDYEGIQFCSSIKRNNVFASQFHPEKSGKAGIAILNNFKNIIEKHYNY